MSTMDHLLPARREAKLRYGDNKFDVVRSGDFVRCAVTGDPIPLSQLHYWSPRLQEAYRDVQTSLKRYLDQNNLNDAGRPR